MKTKELIPIFLSSDDGYAPYLAAALVSLMENASRDYDYKIIVMNDGLSQENYTKIKSLQREGFDIEFAPMRQYLEQMTEKESNRLRCDYFTLTIYFRIFIPVMFPQYDKGIYIDSDVVVPGDISELYNINLGDNLIGACVDQSIQHIPPFVKYIDEAVGVDHTKYINSGILLLNMDALRRVRMDQRFLELLNGYHFDSIAPDQDYINAMCAGKIRFIDNIWDVYPDNQSAPLETPKLIHYNLFEKPWCRNPVQYEEYFWHYAEKSGYIDEIRAFKNAYTPEQVAQDDATLQSMAVRALEIVESGARFRDVKVPAFITSNHFNPIENTAIRLLSQKLHRGNLYVISQDTNLMMEGFFGFFMYYMDIIPISPDMDYMTHHFENLVDEALKRGQNILIYPEQEMWFNYRKPRPPKRGAYHYAAKHNTPVIPCFNEIRELPEMETEHFHKVQYVLHVLQPIYPDPAKSLRQNSLDMARQDYEQKKAAYEKAYGKPLDYAFSDWDIAGWEP